MTKTPHLRKSQEAGYSLLEALISLAVLIVVASSAMGGMFLYQKNYRSSELQRGLHQQMRGALEQMAQEIGQSGLTASQITKTQTLIQSGGSGASAVNYLTQAQTASTGSTVPGQQPVPLYVANTTGIFVGQTISIDANGTLEEGVKVKAVDRANSRIDVEQLIFDHAVNDAVYLQGVYPTGVLPKDGTTGYSTDSSLTIYGDINADGTMDMVKYVCPNPAPGPLIRYTYDMGSGTCPNWPSKSTILLDNVTACSFTYGGETSGSSYAELSAGPDDSGRPAGTKYRFVLSVGISLTAQSATKDPETNQYFKLKKSYLNIQPRNIVSAYYNLKKALAANATSYGTVELQPTPPSDAASGSIFYCLP